MKKSDLKVLGGLAVGGLATWGLLSWLSRKTGMKPQPGVYVPGDVAHVYEGQSIVVRLPLVVGTEGAPWTPADYEVLNTGGDLAVLSQRHDQLRRHTDVALLIGRGNVTINPFFQSTANPQQQYELTIVSYPVPQPEALG